MSKNFIHTFLSVDCVIFGFDDYDLNVLLVEKDRSYNNRLKLPGSLIYDNEDVDDAAGRVLYELTGIKNMSLKQFRCFSSPERASDPEDVKWLSQEYQPGIDRLITVAYLALCKRDRKLNKISKYKRIEWISVNNLPSMPFDHNRIVEESMKEIKQWIDSDPAIAYELLPQKFTVSNLHSLYESVYNKKIDIRNFHKKISSLNYLMKLDEKETGVSHRAACYYKFDKKAYNRIGKF